MNEVSMVFLKNCWYCAGWSSELTDKPIGYKMLDQDVVLYRKKDGSVVAVSGICRHRFAPLADGKVVDDKIECPYHGLQYDETGSCVYNPHGSGKIPPRADLESYSVIEKSGAIWIWMGDSEKADASKIPDFDFVSDRENWSGLTGYLRIEANYQLVIDNLMDLTHAAYLHPTTVGQSPDAWIGDMKMEHKCFVEGDILTSDYVFFNSPPTPLLELFTDIEVGDIYTPMILYPASTMILDMYMTTPKGAKSEGVAMPSCHFLVPESDNSCHYFYAISRNVKLDDDEITAAMGALVGRAFIDEDALIIKKCQEAMGNADFFDLKPVILETDIAAVRARRMLQKMINAEKS
ncbi:MAG: aromatic ring-hydroxylating dioxygenase subunit alpha [Emcibacter sp.]|nr:aromatic ring-hydroxylating dioxygenase subunit alpha [Emcibacter sp.]